MSKLARACAVVVAVATSLAGGIAAAQIQSGVAHKAAPPSVALGVPVANAKTNANANANASQRSSFSATAASGSSLSFASGQPALRYLPDDLPTAKDPVRREAVKDGAKESGASARGATAPGSSGEFAPAPGVLRANMPPVTFADAQRVLKARVLPANVNQGVAAVPKTSKTSASASTLTSAMKISGDGNALGPASIAELARSLRHHPDLIYQYVRNTIEYYPVFGSQKGALGAVLDNQATAHDQATLMVELLRASGVEANYVRGIAKLSAAQLGEWWGVSTANACGVLSLLGQAQIPVYEINATSAGSCPGIAENSWAGAGYFTVGSGLYLGSVISNGLSGGFATQPQANVFTNTAVGAAMPAPPTIENYSGSAYGDPIDMVQGHFLYNHEDLDVGVGAFPQSLSFQRLYSSGLRHQSGPLGKGWTHNFNARAATGSDGFQANNPGNRIDPTGLASLGAWASSARASTSLSTLGGDISWINGGTAPAESGGASYQVAWTTPLDMLNARRNSVLDGGGGGRGGDGGGLSAGAQNAAKEITLSRKVHGEAAQHAADAINAGKPDVLTIHRAGAPANRQASTGALDKVAGKHLDEYPPAMFREGGAGASVRPINPRDNMSGGACIGNACRGLPDGTQVRIRVGD